MRNHRRKVEDLEAEEARDIGFWLPVLAKAVRRVTGTADYNVVQNNGMLLLVLSLYVRLIIALGARAAQVVPHVHFHIIPRPAHVPELKNKSWTMFGRGQREDLDDDDGESLAAKIRQELRSEVEARFGTGSKL